MSLAPWEAVANEGTLNSFLATERYQEASPAGSQEAQLMLLGGIFQVLAKYSLCVLFVFACLFGKVKYHFQGNEKIKTLLETFPRLNYLPRSLESANIFLPAMLSFIKIWC